MGVKYNNEGGRGLGPYQVVKRFQHALNEAGQPIEFTGPSGQLKRQLAHAKRLLSCCGHRPEEVMAMIEEYVKDPWWVDGLGEGLI